MSTRFSAIAHGDLLLWNPLNEAATLALVDSLDVPPTAHLLDVGCGRAELLIRLVARTGASGLGIDASPTAIALARKSADDRIDLTRIGWGVGKADGEAFADATVNVAFCVGATHALGGLRGTLRTLHRLLVPGGTAIVGEGHWLREPDAEYLAFLDAKRDDLLDHAGNLALAQDEGFDVVRTLVSSKDDFDAYEDRYAANVERFVAEHPDDPDADAFRTRIRAWRAAYLRWGRDTLGFALYVLRRR